jgi:hypothetical protein
VTLGTVGQAGAMCNILNQTSGVVICGSLDPNHGIFSTSNPNPESRLRYSEVWEPRMVLNGINLSEMGLYYQVCMEWWRTAKCFVWLLCITEHILGDTEKYLWKDQKPLMFPALFEYTILGNAVLVIHVKVVHQNISELKISATTQHFSRPCEKCSNINSSYRDLCQTYPLQLPCEPVMGEARSICRQSWFKIQTIKSPLPNPLPKYYLLPLPFTVLITLPNNLSLPLPFWSEKAIPANY